MQTIWRAPAFLRHFFLEFTNLSGTYLLYNRIKWMEDILEGITMNNKKKTVIIALISALLFCTLIAAASLSPLSELGKHANQFNSVGMWSSIGMILIFYIVPIGLYLAGLNWMKYVMAILCTIGLFGFISTFLVVTIIGVVMASLTSLLGVLIVCGLASIINVIWFFVTFRSKKMPD